MTASQGTTTSHSTQPGGARVGVVTFPGSLDDRDAMRAVRMAGAEPVALWHDDPDLRGVDAVVLPGGFSYGDYLRAGSIARFATVMTSVAAAARRGLPVLGICNGFQILCEAGLLPGALVRNRHLHFRNRDQWLRVESAATVWTSGYTAGQQVLIPIKHAEGCYVADERTLEELEGEGRVVVRYATDEPDGNASGIAGNPNGSQRDIAGVCNADGNVVGLMPHPEHAIEALTGPSTDGLAMFTGVLAHLGQPVPAAVAP